MILHSISLSPSLGLFLCLCSMCLAVYFGVGSSAWWSQRSVQHPISKVHLAWHPLMLRFTQASRWQVVLQSVRGQQGDVDRCRRALRQLNEDMTAQQDTHFWLVKMHVKITDSQQLWSPSKICFKYHFKTTHCL